MGAWAEHEFGVKILPPRAYLFAGPSSAGRIGAVIGSFGKVLFHRHDVYDRYLVTGGDATVMFQLYGAPIMCDLVTVLKDGNVREAIFFGYAYGRAEGMRVGDCVVPSQAQTLDGVTARLGAGTHTVPDAEMTEIISELLQRNQIPFRKGRSVSVPATFWHGDERQIDPDAIALELEFAAFCHCACVAGIKAGGLFVISDTREHGLLDKGIPRDAAMLKAFRAIKEHWEQ
jgi:purine-nucleoside phosphorylase